MDGSAGDKSDGWLAAEWMMTASGARFYPTKPDPDAVKITDIAHALGNLCRYNGHVRFYSVAEHSVHMARHFVRTHRNDLARWALLHDAAEAYLGDVIRPLKKALPQYVEIEQAVEAAVAQAFGLPLDMPPEIKAADTAILNDERRQLFPTEVVEASGWMWRPGLGILIEHWGPAEGKREFLDTYAHLFERGLG